MEDTDFGKIGNRPEQIATMQDGPDSKATVWVVTERGEVWYFVLRDGYWRKQEFRTEPPEELRK